MSFRMTSPYNYYMYETGDCVCHLCWKVHWGIEGRYGVNPPTRKETGSAKKETAITNHPKQNLQHPFTNRHHHHTEKQNPPQNPSSGKTQSSTFPDRPSPPQPCTKPRALTPSPPSHPSIPATTPTHPTPTPALPHLPLTPPQPLSAPLPRLSHPMTYPPSKTKQKHDPAPPDGSRIPVENKFRGFRLDKRHLNIPPPIARLGPSWVWQGY